jgi:hypothetical protein
MKEIALEKKLGVAVRKIGGLYLKMPPDFCIGIPDRLLITRGYFGFVELKTEQGVLTPKQNYMVNKLRDLGVPVQVLHGEQEVNNFILHICSPTPCSLT